MMNVFFGIFIYGRLVKSLGLNNVILLIPFFFSSLFFGWMFSARLLFPVLGFIASEVVLNMLEDNNFNLLLNAVPLKLKNKIRIACESCLEPLGMIFSASLLLLFRSHSKILGFALGCILLVCSLLLRATYMQGIFYNLIEHVVCFGKNISSRTARISKKIFIKSEREFFDRFFFSSEKEQLFMAEYAFRFCNASYIRRILNKITKLSGELKLSILSLYEKLEKKEPDLSPYVLVWMEQHPEMQRDFFQFLIRQNVMNSDFLRVIFQSPSFKQNFCPDMPAYNAAEKEDIEALFSSEKESLLLTGLLMAPRHPETAKKHIFPLLNRLPPRLQEQALKSLVIITDPGDEEFLPSLFSFLDHLSDPSSRLFALKVMEKMLTPSSLETLVRQESKLTAREKNFPVEALRKLGDPALRELGSLYQCPSLSYKSRLFAMKILGKISSSELKKNFYKIVFEEIKKAYLYHYHFLLLTEKEALLKLTLQNNRDAVLEFILESIACMHRFEASEYFFRSLQSKHPKTYNHALEMFEKMCSPKLHKKLRLLIESGYEKKFLKTYLRENHPVLTPKEILEKIGNTPSILNESILKTWASEKDFFSVDAFSSTLNLGR